MNKNPKGRGSKYTDAFKAQLVAESRAAGATIPMVSKQHGVSTSRIYAWRQDERFQGVAVETGAPGFAEVVVAAADTGGAEPPDGQISQPVRDARIEITLENGRKISISEGVDASFVLELARGLAA